MISRCTNVRTISRLRGGKPAAHNYLCLYLHSVEPTRVRIGLDFKCKFGEVRPPFTGAAS
jgi:hypothetical protein